MSGPIEQEVPAKDELQTVYFAARRGEKSESRELYLGMCRKWDSCVVVCSECENDAFTRDFSVHKGL